MATPTSAAKGEHEFDRWIESSPEDVARAFRKVQSTLDRENVRFDATRLPITIKPSCITTAVEDTRAHASELVLAGLSEIGRLIQNDDAALARVGFDEPARALLRLEPRDTVPIPMVVRGDSLWNDGVGSFVEMNTDSPAMSLFSDVLQTAVLDVLREYKLEFVADVRTYQRTELLVDALLGHYRGHGGDKSDPMIAIVDWTGVKTTAEQRRLANAIIARGARADLFDPGEMTYRDGRLYGRDVEIDLVHRRALFPEFLKKPDEVRGMCRAVRDGKIVMVNPLKAYLTGNKGMLALAHDPAFASRLTPELRDGLARLVPESVFVTDETRETLATADRTEWVIKSSFGSGGSEVILGTVATDEDWRAALAATKTGTWIAQRAAKIPTMTLPVSDGMGWQMAPYYSNWNPWLVDGKYAGATVRCSRAQVISITGHGALTASFALPA